jgi:Sec-independent protein translocase protein TatA
MQGRFVAIQVNSQGLGQSLARLRAALSGLESAADRRLKASGSSETLASELALMQDDRARLAGELDTALARAERLAQANKEVDKRLVTIARSIKKVLGDDKSAASGDEA